MAENQFNPNNGQNGTQYSQGYNQYGQNGAQYGQGYNQYDQNGTQYGQGYNQYGQNGAQQYGQNYNAQQYGAQNGYQQPGSNVNVNVTMNSPVSQLRSDRSLLKMILLSLVTFGIYGIVVMAHIGEEVNVICGRYDGKKTMNYWLLFFLIGPLTLGIGYIVWQHKISARMGDELIRRGINYSFSAADYWLWNVLGTLIVVGPFVYLYKFIKASNSLNADFSLRG